MLESYIKNTLKEKNILLMTHIVLGYPSFDDSFRTVETMVKAGVDLMELQIPFSEPTADGPVIMRANQNALDKGATVEECLRQAQGITQSFDIPFLIMSYYNILFRYGVEDFVAEMSRRNIRGAIVPDLPPEEGKEYLLAMKQKNLCPILIFSPTTSGDRMKYLASNSSGFIYCVARKGVTGKKTDFSEDLTNYLAACREATSLPLAVGFGVKDRQDIDFLKGKVEVAIIGTQTIRIMEEKGIDAVGGFIKNLR